LSSTADGNFGTQYGIIHCRYPGPKKKYSNVNIYHQTDTRFVQLQAPALKAFKAAEARCKTPRRKHILITGVGYRSYDQQFALWKSDNQRFAHPDTSMHVEADAIDVDQGQSTLRLRAIHKALLAEGWHQAVSGEPWHYSFRIAG
jgi:hypothetical protein